MTEELSAVIAYSWALYDYVGFFMHGTKSRFGELEVTVTEI